jgi:hypothetical protein
MASLNQEINRMPNFDMTILNIYSSKYTRFSLNSLPHLLILLCCGGSPVDMDWFCMSSVLPAKTATSILPRHIKTTLYKYQFYAHRVTFRSTYLLQSHIDLFYSNDL